MENIDPIELEETVTVDEQLSELVEEYGNVNIIEPIMLPEEVGGIVSEAFKLILANPDVIVTLTVFSIFIALSLTIIEVFKSFR